MRNLVLVGICLAGLSVELPARADDTLVSGSYARACADQAQVAAQGGAISSDAVANCNKALTDELLKTNDLAATHVNRGVLYLENSPAVAERDFRSAITLVPVSGDAYVDLGAAEIAQGRFDNAIADIDHGMGLAMKEPAKAYFNRALAEDDKGDETAAYYDFRTALQLRPGWILAAQELTRFTVRTVPVR